MSSNIKTPKFRVSYPSVFKPKFNELSKRDEYSIVALFPKDADLSPLKKAAEDAVKEKWGNDPKKWPKKLRLPFRDQAEKEKDGVLPGGHEAGAIFLNLRSKNKPALVTSKNKEIVDIKEPKDFYAGCWAIASLSVYTYDQGGNVGVNFGLVNLFKVGDGDALSAAAANPRDEFEALDDVEADSTATDLFK